MSDAGVIVDKPLKELLNDAYEAFDGSEELDRYTDRHGIDSAGILTVTDDQTASLIVASLAPGHSRWGVVAVNCFLGDA